MSDPGGNFDRILPPLCSSVQIFLDDPAKSLWWYFGDDDGHDDKDDTFVSSMTATKLLRELIPNFPVPLQPDASHLII